MSDRHGAAGFERLRPEVWNLTENEHGDGRTRFLMLKGGSAHRTEGCPWYFQRGVRGPEFTAKYLVHGLGLGRSTSVGFRLAGTCPEGRHDRRTGRPARRQCLDLFAGPTTAMHLGDLGAQVVKVEHPRRPNPARGHEPENDGHNLW